MKDYQKTITVNKPLNEVFASIADHVPDWWSNDFQGSASNAGDSYIICFGETRKKMVIEELVSQKRIVWKCIEAYNAAPSLKKRSEWVGTRMIWTFINDDQGTTLNFLHEGLNQSLDCYQVCEDGWDEYLGSLEAYLKTGYGKPFLKKPQTII